MPGRDGTGPMGKGAMTGRGFGGCLGQGSASYGTGLRRGGLRGAGMIGLAGLGLGLGYGCRRGFRNFYRGDVQGADEKGILEEEKELLKSRLDLISKRLDEISGTEDK